MTGQMSLYEHEILLHKLYNLQLPEVKWIQLHFQQLLTLRKTNFSIVKTNKMKVGNKFFQINFIF